MKTVLKANKVCRHIIRTNLSLILFVLIAIASYQFEISICLFKNITGENCIGCGMTSAIMSFFKFQLFDGINFNWKVIIVAPIMSIITIKSVVAIFQKQATSFR